MYVLALFFKEMNWLRFTTHSHSIWWWRWRRWWWWRRRRQRWWLWWWCWRWRSLQLCSAVTPLCYCRMLGNGFESPLRFTFLRKLWSCTVIRRTTNRVIIIIIIIIIIIMHTAFQVSADFVELHGDYTETAERSSHRCPSQCSHHSVDDSV